MFLKSIPLTLVISLVGSQAYAASFDNFTPLPNSVPAGSLPEETPLLLSSPNFIQESISANDRGPQNGGVKLGDNWDMITLNENGPDAGRYLFSPYETGSAGVRRLDLWTGTAASIVPEGTQGFVSGDASLWTPWGSYLTAEESWGTGSTKGRLFEITNPLDAPGSINFVHRTIIPRVSHEGLAFDTDNNLYFIDELNGGNIYRYTSINPNATNGDDFFAAGQTSVLKVGGGNNANAFGAAIWEALTDINGVVLPGLASAVLGDGTLDGRLAANLAGGTDYQRPEDLEIQTLADGSQFLYFTATTTDDSWSILLNGANPTVNQFVSTNTIDEATGLPVGSVFNSPDNLAIDANGNIYIVEDQPGGDADIWFVRDVNRDGVAESIARWASMSTIGAEPTGLYFDKFNPKVAYLNIQHTASDIDRTIQITVVPEPLTLLGVGTAIGFGTFFKGKKRKFSQTDKKLG
ncbi:protein of unknown function DUF839 [Gloeothece citriformis PCC 7424]|uniref:Phosphatase n=1 Tax=Gloeothece citriformis (strain PCC 7424) TaxID=65393 RepID=B7KGT3_GLOC7|nr:PEP-CTERM sorting domain-containing protein [Gloeothece citriformis]ACK73420.1 protein of unknown function DUF839 [Gloeothece citriformis PCC 7424]